MQSGSLMCSLTQQLYATDTQLSAAAGTPHIHNKPSTCACFLNLAVFSYCSSPLGEKKKRKRKIIVNKKKKSQDITHTPPFFWITLIFCAYNEHGLSRPQNLLNALLRSLVICQHSALVLWNFMGIFVSHKTCLYFTINCEVMSSRRES